MRVADFRGEIGPMTCTRFTRSLIFGSALLFSGTAMFAQGGPGRPDPGAQQFAAYCASCHGLDGSGTARGVAIATLSKVTTLSDADLIGIVRNGVPGKGMPALPQLGDENTKAVVRYLRTLQGVPGPSTTASAVAATQMAGAGTPDKQSAKTAVDQSGPRSTAEPVGIDVQQSDLNQKEIQENWVSYNGDYTGRRYSSLSEVTPANAGHLKKMWVFHTSNVGIMEVTPVVVAGVMFITRSNDAYALDAKTGKQLWHHERAVSEGLIDDASGHINRGVAVLGTRVYMETDNAHLLCLDARSGNLIWDVLYATGNKNYGATSAPLIVKDKVLVGTSGGDDGVRGFLAAYDAQTGKEAWRFWTIPAPGEKGSESWPGDMYMHGGGTTWMPGTYDAELNTIYWGTSNPSPDYDGSVRPGDDLYTSSLLALDPDTGKLKWHFQYNPHDLYDYDAVQTPVLVNADFNGKPRKLVVTANRNGFLYILDRTNGKYLYSKQFISIQNWAKGIDENGRPISNNLIPDEKGVTVCPSQDGGTNWYSPSYDPATNMFYFRSLEACSLFQAKTEPFVDGQEYYSTGAGRPPGVHPSSAYINAFDLNTLDFAWRDLQGGNDPAFAGVMSTAGGLVAFGNDADGFEIDDAHTGKPLWTFNLGRAMHASPMSYGIAGKQYFAVAAGDDVIAFGLP
jgi:alcohol dehydrogenase (cytochrome c)